MMKRFGRTSLYVILVSFVAIQFFRPEKNLGGDPGPNDLIIQHAGMPVPLQEVFRNSCYDCHSDHTRYPWYAGISPFSWIIDRHIAGGKAALNLNEYGLLTDVKKLSVLNDVCDVVAEKSMPPANYLMLHADAVISEDDAEALCDWADEAAMDILRKRQNP